VTRLALALALALSHVGPVLAQLPPPGPPLNRSSIAFTIPEKDLLPENVAYDPDTGAFYVGSTRKGKIVRVDRDGSVRDFVPPRAGGLWMVIGMKVDAERRLLWVASSANGNLVDKGPSDPQSAGLFAFDLDSGRLVERHLLEGPGETHMLNDLVLGPRGDVYVTHMLEEAAVYLLGQGSDRLERLVALDGLRGPNGIALSEDGRTLYVAHRTGIAAIDLASRRVRPVTAGGGANLLGIDGLYYHDHALVAIHPARQLVVRYPLDGSGLQVSGFETIESSHPMFRVPTTGVVVGDTLFYIANAQFESFDEQGNLWPLDRLYEVVVLRVPL